MTVVVTVNVEARYRGFLASVMLEIAPGVYTSPNMTRGIRERIWNVLAEWYYQLGQGSIVMTWRDPSAVGEQQIRTLGEQGNRVLIAPRLGTVALWGLTSPGSLSIFTCYSQNSWESIGISTIR